MACRTKSIIVHIERTAKKGVSEVKLSLYPDEIDLLIEEGFDVKIPKRCDTHRNGKTKYEVLAKWDKARKGTAKRMRNLTEAYAHQSAAKARDFRNARNKQAKAAFDHVNDPDPDDGYDADEPTDEDYYSDTDDYGYAARCAYVEDDDWYSDDEDGDED